VCTCGGRHQQSGVWLAFSLSCIFNGYWLFSFPTYFMASEIIFCTGILHLVFRVQVTRLVNLPSPSDTFSKRGGKNVQHRTHWQKGRSSPFSLSLFAREICFAYHAVISTEAREQSADAGTASWRFLNDQIGRSILWGLPAGRCQARFQLGLKDPGLFLFLFLLFLLSFLLSGWMDETGVRRCEFV